MCYLSVLIPWQVITRVCRVDFQLSPGGPRSTEHWEAQWPMTIDPPFSLRSSGSLYFFQRLWAAFVSSGLLRCLKLSCFCLGSVGLCGMAGAP